MLDDQLHNPLPGEPGLLAAKLRPPLRRGLVNRPRLVQRLHEGSQRALTLVSAPAGWGKSSLLADWHDACGEKVAWLNLDPQDNDPNRFWTYVVAALRRVQPQIGERSLRALASGSHALIEGVLPSLINDVDGAGEPVVLVLDDYHVVTEPEIHRSVEHVLRWADRSLRLVLATRVDPPLPTGRWRAAGELVELRRPDLAFTDDEARRLLSQGLGLDLAEEDLTRLGRRTEGWGAGLYLAGLSMRQQDDRTAFIDAFTGTDRLVFDYLGTEVLAQQPAEVRRFLLRTSVLSRMNADLCAAVTGRSDSAAVLASVAQANGFLIVVDERQEWYRYHRLFGEMLRHELAITEPDLVAELHRRAARWFESRGAVPEAIDHALAGGDVDLAAALVAAHWTPYFNAGLLRTVERWLEALPAPCVTADARLCLARAWTLLDRGRLDAVDTWITAAQRAVTDPATVRDTAVVRAVHRFKIGNLNAAHAAARRILELGGRDGSFAATVAHIVLGLSLFWRG
ncbi:MAG: helix-turn-helix transcriptional regulator, partial [Pseudonocardia sp.]|nr:helix-turn-helix transcriptional regulator [Pseudonocardia sp.]